MSLIPDHSICQVSKALHLDFKNLRERVRQRDNTRGSSGFIELNVRELLPGSECVIEMEHRNGDRMRVSFRGGAEPNLLEMARAFWREP